MLLPLVVAFVAVALGIIVYTVLPPHQSHPHGRTGRSHTFTLACEQANCTKCKEPATIMSS